MFFWRSAACARASGRDHLFRFEVWRVGPTNSSGDKLVVSDIGAAEASNQNERRAWNSVSRVPVRSHEINKEWRTTLASRELLNEVDSD